MINEDIILEAGFISSGEDCYIRFSGELLILLEVSETEFSLTVPCASATVDHESKTDEAIKSLFEGFSRIDVSFAERTLTINSLPSDTEFTSDELCEILALTECARQKFDLLPVCMRCKRVISVKTVRIKDKTEIICGICSDSYELKRKHKEQIEYFRKLEKERIKKKHVYFRAIKRGVFSGARAGLAAGALGLFLMFLGIVFKPEFRLMAIFPGMLIGFFTMLEIKKTSALPFVSRYILITSAALVSVFIVSTINAEAVYMIFEKALHVSIEPPEIPLFGDIGQINLYFGISGILIMQTAMMWSKEDDTVSSK